MKQRRAMETCFERDFRCLLVALLNSPQYDEPRSKYWTIFKLFSRTAARRLFPSQHIERWAFDVELLCLCAAQSINIKEIGVRWQEIDGSKLDVMTDTINMARDLVLIRLCYLLGVWNIEPAKKSE